MAQSNVLPFEPPPAAARHPRAGFENIPRDLSKAELLRYFIYSPEDLSFSSANHLYCFGRKDGR